MSLEMKSKEICQIIKACVDSKVKALKVGELQLEFYDQNPYAMYYPPQAPVARPKEPQVVQLAKVSLDEKTRKVLEAMELEQEEEELALSDPLAYERMLAEGHLEDEAPSGQDDRRSKQGIPRSPSM